MPYKDPVKQKQAQRKHYLANKAKYLEASNANRHTRRLALMKYITELKTNAACIDCKENLHFAAMDFDHVRGKKVGPVGKLVHELVPLAVLKEEIAKCELVCSNCHRVRTWKRYHKVPLD